MTVWGVSMCKDEADVIEGTLRHMADEVDHLLVADNLSIDGTRDILAELAGALPLTVVDDPDPAHFQSRKMSALAAQAAEHGATWIVPFDADELWFARSGRLREVLPALPPANVAFASLTNHYSTAVDPEDPDPFLRMVWRSRDPLPLPKVAFRWEPGAVIHEGNHGVTFPGGQLQVEALEIRHFPYRSAEQFVRKARNGATALQRTDLPESVGAHWRSYGGLLDRFGEEGLAAVYKEHFWFLSPTDSGLVLDPAPYRRWPH